MIDLLKKLNLVFNTLKIGPFCRKLKIISLAIFRLIIFFFITIMLLPIFFVGKFGKLIISTNLDFMIRSFWSKFGLWLCNVSVVVNGKVSRCDAYVCNHVSWLDILALQSILDISFVAKSEVKRWPVFGFLAKIVDTIFVDRRAMAAKTQQFDLIRALKAGKSLCFFPEGTSTDGLQVLPFKSSLFEVFISFDKPDSPTTLVQPVSLIYSTLELGNETSLGWWGDMNLVLHIFDVVGSARPGKVEIIFEEPIDAKKIGDRKKLALAVEVAIKKNFIS